MVQMLGNLAIFKFWHQMQGWWGLFKQTQIGQNNQKGIEALQKEGGPASICKHANNPPSLF